MAEKNLWGDFDELEIIETPAGIVKKQASILFQKTKGLLVGQVSPRVAARNRFAFSFSIVVPTMNNYSYEVLRFGYSLDMYPVRIQDVLSGKIEECKDQEQFEIMIESILSSEKMRGVLSSLISQAKT